MNSDSQYLIGHSHHVCEDYALSGFYNGLHYAIVADGCSASKDVDIGARVLAKSAEGVIRSVYEHHYQPHYYWDIVGKMIISNAQKTIRSLGVPDTALDSTLSTHSIISFCPSSTFPLPMAKQRRLSNMCPIVSPVFRSMVRRLLVSFSA